MAEHVLIVEDDAKIAALLTDYLQNSGFETTTLGRGDQVEAAVRASAFDLILLDLGLPGLNGLEVFKRVRAFSDIPVSMLTARVDEIDRLLGLELGADDYICKPFSPREVVARVKALLRRAGRRDPGSAGGLVLDAAGCKATVRGVDLNLTAVEFHLLRILHDHPGQVFTRGQLMDGMYGDFRVVSERTVDSHVKKLRQKIALALPQADVVRSVYGMGYKYEP